MRLSEGAACLHLYRGFRIHRRDNSVAPARRISPNLPLLVSKDRAIEDGKADLLHGWY